MSDVQVLVGPNAVWFGQNSDREPGEPQPVVRLPAVAADDAPTVRATYIELPQVPRRHGVILSRPVWCWGAEMGLNDRGVAKVLLGLCRGRKLHDKRENLKKADMQRDIQRALRRK